MGFGRILEGKMEASWHQNQRKIDANFESQIFEKTLFFLRKNHDFEGSKGCKIEENSMKNQVKREGQDGVPLGIDFLRILVDFGRQVGLKMAPKINKKEHQKTMKI